MNFEYEFQELKGGEMTEWEKIPQSAMHWRMKTLLSHRFEDKTKNKYTS